MFAWPGFKPVELQAGSTFNTGERFDSLSPREVSRPLVPVAEDHKSKHKPLLRVTSSIIEPVTRPLSGETNFVKSIYRQTFTTEIVRLAKHASVGLDLLLRHSNLAL